MTDREEKRREEKRRLKPDCSGKLTLKKKKPYYFGGLQERINLAGKSVEVNATHSILHDGNTDVQGQPTTDTAGDPGFRQQITGDEYHGMWAENFSGHESYD